MLPLTYNGLSGRSCFPRQIAWPTFCLNQSCLRWAKWALHTEQRQQDHNHLLQVDKKKQGHLHWSVQLEMKESNCGFKVPWVTAVLFGESKNYCRIGGELVPPLDRYWMVVRR